MRALPELLFFCTLPEVEKALFMLEDQKRLDAPLADPRALLQNYLKYYEIALSNPSPFFPDWAEALLNGSPEELAKEIASSRSTLDPYREWLLQREGSLDAEAILANWAPLLREYFGGVCETI
jgi:hypothetical protein